MKAFADNELFFYLTSDTYSKFFPFRFKSFESHMKLLNFWGGLQPDVWGKTDEYHRIGQDKFFRITQKFIDDLSSVVAEIKRNPDEREAKSMCENLLEAVSNIAIGNYLAFTRFISPEIGIPLERKMLLSLRVSMLNKGKSIEFGDKEYRKNLSPIFDTFEIHLFGSSRHTIGKQQNRVCRFCSGKEADGIKFSSDAHAIPKSVGNNLLFCNEECNDCNGIFGRGIETDFGNYFAINRAFHPIKTRSKNIYIGENFCIDKNGNCFVDEITPIEKARGSKRLNCKETVTDSSLYRSLAKFVINLIDEKYLNEFHDTIDWIRGKMIPKLLPPVLVAECTNPIEQPTLTLFIRKPDKGSGLPFCTALMQCIDRAFFFIMPLALSDQKIGCFNLSTLNQLASLFAPLLPAAEHWYPEDLSSSQPKYVWRDVKTDGLIIVDNLNAKKADLHKPGTSTTRQQHVEFKPFSQNKLTISSYRVINFKEYCRFSSLPQEEYLNNNLEFSNILYLSSSGDIKLDMALDCSSFKKRRIFSYEQSLTFRLRDFAASVSIDDDSFCVDHEMVRELLRQNISFAAMTLKHKYHQPLEIYPVDETTLNYSLHTLTIIIKHPSGSLHQVTGKDCWNIKFLHI